MSVSRSAASGRGSAARNASHARAASAYCAVAQRLPGREQRAELVGRELPESLETRMAGERADALIRLTVSGDRMGPADSAQQLNEIELIEEVVLVPEDQLVVRLVIVDDLAPAAAARQSSPPDRHRSPHRSRGIGHERRATLRRSAALEQGHRAAGPPRSTSSPECRSDESFPWSTCRWRREGVSAMSR